MKKKQFVTMLNIYFDDDTEIKFINSNNETVDLTEDNVVIACSSNEQYCLICEDN